LSLRLDRRGLGQQRFDRRRDERLVEPVALSTQYESVDGVFNAARPPCDTARLPARTSASRGVLDLDRRMVEHCLQILDPIMPHQ
jgi:hypothetical protein